MMVINGPKKNLELLRWNLLQNFPPCDGNRLSVKTLNYYVENYSKIFLCLPFQKKISTRFFSRFQLKWMFLITSRPVITFHSNIILIIISVINLTWIIILRWNKIISNTLTLKQNFLMFLSDSHSMVKF